MTEHSSVGSDVGVGSLRDIPGVNLSALCTNLRQAVQLKQIRAKSPNNLDARPWTIGTWF